MATEATKIPFVEAAAPATPAASRVVIYAKSDGLMYSKDDAGAETLMSGGSAGAVATDSIWDAAGDLAVGSGANTAAKLTKGTTAQVLVSTSTTVAWADVLPWHVVIIPMVWTSDATTGTWAITGSNDSGLVFAFYTPGSTANSGRANGFESDGVQNSAIAYDVILAAGTWDAHFWVRKSTNTAIITLNEDGASKGTVDTYAAAAAAAKVSITGWTIAATGKKRMQIIAATKNASSSSYFLHIEAIEFRRTA